MSNERRHWHQFSASCYACINFHLRGLCCTCEQPLHIATGISHANNWAWFWKNVLMVCWCFCMHDVKDRQACSFKGPVNSLWHFFLHMLSTYVHCVNKKLSHLASRAMLHAAGTPEIRQSCAPLWTFSVPSSHVATPAGSCMWHHLGKSHRLADESWACILRRQGCLPIMSRRFFREASIQSTLCRRRSVGGTVGDPFWLADATRSLPTLHGVAAAAA